VAVVYLNLGATSATARFQERQYPMLNDGSRWWAMLGTSPLVSPGLQPVSIAYMAPGRSDAVTVAQSLTVVDREFPVEAITLEPGTAALLAPDIVQGELNLRAGIYSGYTTQRLWKGPFLRPNNAVISSPFGVFRSYNGGPATDYHRGTDFAGLLGDPVVASAAGRVVFTGALQIRGNAIVIDHGAGVFTAYHHLSAINVGQGQTVTAGQLIGAVGSTGLVAGAHLHWEVLVRGIEVDGEHWLAGKEIGPQT
jgi:lysostaphin